MLKQIAYIQNFHSIQLLKINNYVQDVVVTILIILYWTLPPLTLYIGLHYARQAHQPRGDYSCRPPHHGQMIDIRSFQYLLVDDYANSYFVYQFLISILFLRHLECQLPQCCCCFFCCMRYRLCLGKNASCHSKSPFLTKIRLSVLASTLIMQHFYRIDFFCTFLLLNIFQKVVCTCMNKLLILPYLFFLFHVPAVNKDN